MSPCTHTHTHTQPVPTFTPHSHLTHIYTLDTHVETVYGSQVGKMEISSMNQILIELLLSLFFSFGLYISFKRDVCCFLGGGIFLFDVQFSPNSENHTHTHMPTNNYTHKNEPLVTSLICTQTHARTQTYLGRLQG